MNSSFSQVIQIPMTMDGSHLHSSSSPLSSPNASDAAASKFAALGQVTVLSAAMLIAAFGAGIVPLYATLSQKQLSLVNSLGTGLLLGTALAVIIPEGIHELYHESSGAHEIGEHEHEHEHEHSFFTNELIIGSALISGFILMLLIDHLACCRTEHMHGHSHHHHGRHSGHHSYSKIEMIDHPGDTKDLSDLGIASDYEDEDEEQDYDGSDTSNRGQNMAENFDDVEKQKKQKGKTDDSSRCSQPNTVENKQKRLTVTIGLLVHAAADGIALGAAKATSAETWSHVELVVFLAIMMHKIPAAFALTVYLRNSGLEAPAIRTNLFLFALAAPLGSIFTFLVLHPGFLGIGVVSESFVSFVLLFSGGSFLYVSLVHAFQELPRDGKLSNNQIAAVCCGCILPIILSAGHEH